MQSLADVIVALRHEMDAALGGNQSLSENVRLEADRVIVTLAFQIEKSSESAAINFNFDPRATGVATNSLAIEFKCHFPGVTPGSADACEPQLKELQGSSAETLTHRLSQVFGAPGFDSSARATVFREALEPLDATQIKSAIHSLAGSAVDPIPDDVKRSIALIQRVCQAGPGGGIEGKKILVEILRKHSTEPVLDLIHRVWKTQQDWLG